MRRVLRRFPDDVPRADGRAIVDDDVRGPSGRCRRRRARPPRRRRRRRRRTPIVPSTGAPRSQLPTTALLRIGASCSPLATMMAMMMIGFTYRCPPPPPLVVDVVVVVVAFRHRLLL
jgi:hypothetical protein